MCPDHPRRYSRSIRRACPKAERGETVFYSDYQLGKDRMEQVRAEIRRNRLEAALARGSRLWRAGYARGSVLVRGTAPIGTLIK